MKDALLCRDFDESELKDLDSDASIGGCRRYREFLLDPSYLNSLFFSSLPFSTHFLLQQFTSLPSLTSFIHHPHPSSTHILLPSSTSFFHHPHLYHNTVVVYHSRFPDFTCFYKHLNSHMSERFSNTAGISGFYCTLCALVLRS